jgi:type II secretory pathway component PulF
MINLSFFKKTTPSLHTAQKKKVSGGLLAELTKMRGNPRLSTQEQMLFAKRLSFLVGANVSLLESFHMLKEQTRNARIAYVYERIIRDIENGQFLSASLKKFGKTFSPFAINLIRVGELSGSLTQNLIYLAEELKKRNELRKKIIGALVYPIIITIATLGITGMLTVFIFPKIMPIFISLNVDLPITTKVLLWVSTFLSQYGLWVIAGLIASVVGIVFLYQKVSAMRFALDRAILALPITGPIARSYHMANFCRTTGLLLKSGLTLSEAIHIMKDTVGNVVYAQAIERAGKGIQAGKQLSGELQKEKNTFPHMMTHMIGIGERTGNLSGTLIYLSDLYESEVEDMTRNLSSSIEPVLMIVMGLMVGLVAVSVITPIYEITSKLSR